MTQIQRPQENAVKVSSFKFQGDKWNTLGHTKKNLKA
jgi:hypothetical protein